MASVVAKDPVSISDALLVNSVQAKEIVDTLHHNNHHQIVSAIVEKASRIVLEKYQARTNALIKTSLKHAQRTSFVFPPANA
jgi:hypothetical protein